MRGQVVDTGFYPEGGGSLKGPGQRRGEVRCKRKEVKASLDLNLLKNGSDLNPDEGPYFFSCLSPVSPTLLYAKR